MLSFGSLFSEPTAHRHSNAPPSLTEDYKGPSPVSARDASTFSSMARSRNTSPFLVIFRSSCDVLRPPIMHVVCRIGQAAAGNNGGESHMRMWLHSYLLATGAHALPYSFCSIRFRRNRHARPLVNSNAAIHLPYPCSCPPSSRPDIYRERKRQDKSPKKKFGSLEE